MPSSPPSSHGSARCRIEWHPSRWPVAGLLVLAVAAPASVMQSALPAPSADAVAGLVALYALWLARCASRGAPCAVEWVGGRVRLLERGAVVPLARVRVEFRGPIVRLAGRDARGRTRRLLWWPDTLPARDRRRMVLAARAGTDTGNSPASVAA